MTVREAIVSWRCGEDEATPDDWIAADSLIEYLEQAGFQIALLGEERLVFVEARNIKEGDHIMWAGHRCVVTRAHRELRQKHQHRIFMSLDLDVENLPPQTGVRWEVNELVELSDNEGKPE